MIVRVDWRLATQRCTGYLTTTVGDHLIHIHVELRAAARHPYMQGKHILMLASEDFVTNLNDQLVALVVEPFARMVGIGGCFLQRGKRSDHLARDQILAYAEVFQRALGLRSP